MLLGSLSTLKMLRYDRRSLSDKRSALLYRLLLLVNLRRRRLVRVAIFPLGTEAGGVLAELSMNWTSLT